MSQLLLIELPNINTFSLYIALKKFNLYVAGKTPQGRRNGIA